MKKVWLMFVFLILLSSFVFAAGDPDAPVSEDDAEKLQENIDTYVPINDDGKVDFDGYKPFRTKADERIDSINLWLVENASWLKVVFGMVPSITWLFVANFYLLLLFFVTLVLNGKFIDFFIYSEKEIDLILFKADAGNILGAVIFLFLLLTKIIANLATFMNDAFGIFWNYILPAGIVVAVICMVIIFGLLIVLAIYAPQVFRTLGVMVGERRKRKAAEKEAVNREALEKITNNIVQN